MRHKLLYILPVAILIVFLTVYGGTEKNNSTLKQSNYLAAVRLIGHELLLSAGDKESRVMPITKLSDAAFQIQFENQLSLEPDSIVSIVSRTTKLASLPATYAVNVQTCSGNEIVYSYVMSDLDNINIVPCLGRTLPMGCYYVNIDFSISRWPDSPGSYFVAGAILLLLASAYLFHFYSKKKKSAIPGSTGSSPGSDTIPIGEFLFHFDKRTLEIYGQQIELTGKESELLYIFASAPNEIIDRDQLQKDVWENEGVIVTRSLDVFISRLRKKLEKDPAVKLINVHGKGYKLEIPVG
jgi:DNA-binding winged helix-turn-helix (wHTH) protein